MAQRTLARHSWAQPVPERPRRKRKRFRWLRRLFVLCVVSVLCVLAVWTYLLHVYAPGLRTEAHTVPALVHEGLAAHQAAYLALGGMSPDLRHAIVAIEDRRFYYHPGVDPLGLIRALWVNLTNQHVDQGGSTLEEQLVKRAIIHDDRSVHAKIRTMALAWAVDQEFSKSQILELYLNAAYYGQGAYGADAAARVYFGTDAAHLTLPQAAFLAAMPQAPSIYGAHPLAPSVIRRQHTVLEDMAQLGYITEAQKSTAEQTPLRFAFPNP